MAAGLGFKDFTTGEVLTAGDVDGYLMQGIWVFASAAARDAAVTSPQEGNFAFTKDTNGLWYYDGAAWVASGATGDIEGVTAGIGISGGGTSGTVTVTNSMATAIDAKGDLVVGTGADTFAKLTVGANGTTLVADSSTSTGLKWDTPAAGGGMTLLQTLSLSGSSTTSASISSSYTNLYFAGRAIANATNAGSSVSFRFNGDTGSNYFYKNTVNSGASVTVDSNTNTASFFGNMGTGTAYNTVFTFDIHIPRYTEVVYKPTTTSSIGSSSGVSEFYNGRHMWNNTAAISTVTFNVNVGSFASGSTVYIYGVN